MFNNPCHVVSYMSKTCCVNTPRPGIFHFYQNQTKLCRFNTITFTVHHSMFLFSFFFFAMLRKSLFNLAFSFCEMTVISVPGKNLVLPFFSTKSR